MLDYRLSSTRLAEVAAAKGDHTSYAIAKRTGVAQSTLSRLRRGVASPATETLLALADAYEVTVEELVEILRTRQSQHRKRPVGNGPENKKDVVGAATPTTSREHNSTSTTVQ
ncbi:helix-turn-helix transcriptional regulator [Streptomyces sp. Z26]|uniref:helix-turn-helix domain-containing protein n=1 Tax=Streptomyces sp. Z26 TaxID=2500177 RepID=UPI000EF1618B|nr:helix-turn-helix transcriptional regulator [Streptomyces sp. Z26]RLL68167.1 XRE family transcriptional regulator [Streptomyces sp. Z26]